MDSLRDLPDLSNSYKDPTIPFKQRKLVDRELQDMRNGTPPPHFLALATVLNKMDFKAWSSLVDVGCATGYYLEIIKYLVSRPIKYLGLDYSLSMLNMAKKRYPDGSFACMDIGHLGLRSRSFDIVLSGATLVHVREWKEAVLELSRVTKEWIVLHRTLVCFSRPTFIRVEEAYGVDVYRVYIQEAELIHLLDHLGFRLSFRVDCSGGHSGSDFGVRTYSFIKKDR